jgi:uncharacterized Zn finger protein (UPF0148 family)
MPKTRGYTEKQAIADGMHYSTDKHCPECGCPWYGNKDLLGEGYRMCCDCHQDWWTNIKYNNVADRREIPQA